MTTFPLAPYRRRPCADLRLPNSKLSQPPNASKSTLPSLSRHLLPPANALRRANAQPVCPLLTLLCTAKAHNSLIYCIIYIYMIYLHLLYIYEHFILVLSSALFQIRHRRHVTFCCSSMSLITSCFLHHQKFFTSFFSIISWHICTYSFYSYPYSIYSLLFAIIMAASIHTPRLHHYIGLGRHLVFEACPSCCISRVCLCTPPQGIVDYANKKKSFFSDASACFWC